MEIRQLGNNVGAEISGMALSRLLEDVSSKASRAVSSKASRDVSSKASSAVSSKASRDAGSALHQAWLDHIVLRIRRQQLTDDQLKRFSARFGELEYAPMGRITDEERARLRNPFVTVISNIVEDGRPIGGLGSDEAAWHTDMSYIELPPKASLLYAVEVPPVGGDTHFANMYAAYDALPDDLKERIARLLLKHDAAHTSVGQLRRGFQHALTPVDAPGAIHPIVRTHDETGRKCLFLGRRKDAYVVGLSLEESEMLLDRIWRYATLPQNCWTQHWQVGDVVIWDNRCAMHRRDGFAEDARRLMRRTQIKGERVM